MKICFVSNLHLFSEIGGNWPEDSFRIFTEKILPAIKENGPDAVIFMGNIIAPPSGLPDSDGKIIAERNTRFVDALKNANIKNAFSLKGKYDVPESLITISEMGGPRFVHNEWVKFGAVACYFFSSRYPDVENAEHDLESIPRSDADTSILLMDENFHSLDPEKSLTWGIFERVSNKFDIIINAFGHYPNHFCLGRDYPTVWCLFSTLPWRRQSRWTSGRREFRREYAISVGEIKIGWNEGEDPVITQHDIKFGIHFFDSQKRSLEFFPVDIGIKFVFANLMVGGTPATSLKERLIRLSKLISEIADPKSTIIRIDFWGHLKSNKARLVGNKWIWDMEENEEKKINFSNIQTQYFQDFYNGSGNDLFYTHWQN